MKVETFAGGKESRLAEEIHIKPKPMVEIGGWPRFATPLKPQVEANAQLKRTRFTAYILLVELESAQE